MYRNIKAVNRKFFHWGECDDQHQDCEAWAQKGMCDEEPEKMHSWCPWSCHKCAPELMGKYLNVLNNANLQEATDRSFQQNKALEKWVEQGKNFQVENEPKSHVLYYAGTFVSTLQMFASHSPIRGLDILHFNL